MSIVFRQENSSNNCNPSSTTETEIEKASNFPSFTHYCTAYCELVQYPNWLEFFLHKKTYQMTAVYYKATNLFKKETEIASHFFSSLSPEFPLLITTVFLYAQRKLVKLLQLNTTIVHI